ncbi:hypothetical protein [Noviherbaspirillum malthae]|uniref:hypothetical protein n=1 Tax=Noviherbaspirillum malthae TaxID=1260987 RepID=UPI00188E3DA8|nr:hypothetical protein [Noviherbaspirillum malthae]
MTHLEQLIAEYYNWQGFLVKQNIKVGRRPAGGWEMELDVVAYHPHDCRLIHVEASLDADPWTKREERYAKKFEIGEKYILNEVFTWLPPDTKIERLAIFPSAPQGRTQIAGARLRSIDGFMKEVRDEVMACKVMAKEAIPEQYPLLRTMQLTLKGYHRRVD